jgi:orotate phosphoribosyltransferase
MSTTATIRPQLRTEHEVLVGLLRDYALVKGEVTLSSGAKAEYLVDAKRVLMRSDGFSVIRRLVSERIAECGATAVGGLTLGADGIAYAALAAEVDVKMFVVRRKTKEHGLRQLIEGPPLEPSDKCLIVDDVVTTGASTIKAIEAIQERGCEICGVLAVLDRLAGGAKAIEDRAHAPFEALTTIDDVYPDRPDRERS